VYYNSSQISDLFKEEQIIKERDEVRVTWILIPDTKTKEEVQERLNRYPNIRIKKVLSNNPILEENQIKAINDGILSLYTVAKAQVLRFPDTKGIILDKMGLPIYRRFFLAFNGLDLRGKEELMNFNILAVEQAIEKQEK